MVGVSAYSEGVVKTGLIRDVSIVLSLVCFVLSCLLCCVRVCVVSCCLLDYI